METQQIRWSTKDRAWELYMQLRSKDPHPDTDLMSKAIILADQFDSLFYSYYKGKQPNSNKNE